MKRTAFNIMFAVVFVMAIPAGMIFALPHEFIIEHKFKKFCEHKEYEGRIKETVSVVGWEKDFWLLRNEDRDAAERRAVEAYRRIVSGRGESDERKAFYTKGKRGLAVLCLMKEVAIRLREEESAAEELADLYWEGKK